MDFTLSKEHEMLQKAVREFAKKKDRAKCGSVGCGSLFSIQRSIAAYG